MSYEEPSPVNLGRKRGNFIGIAGVTERETWDDLSQPGGRALSLWLTPENHASGKNFWVSTYATNRGNNDHW